MSNIAWAYGICNKHGVDTKDLEPWEVITKAAELSKEQGAKRENFDEGLANAVERVNRTKKSVQLSKKDYAIIRAEAFKRYANKKVVSYGYSDNFFVVYHYFGGGDLQPLLKVKIEGNEERISKIEKEFKEWN